MSSTQPAVWGSSGKDLKTPCVCPVSASSSNLAVRRMGWGGGNPVACQGGGSLPVSAGKRSAHVQKLIFHPVADKLFLLRNI